MTAGNLIEAIKSKCSTGEAVELMRGCPNPIANSIGQCPNPIANGMGRSIPTIQ